LPLKDECKLNEQQDMKMGISGVEIFKGESRNMVGESFQHILPSSANINRPSNAISMTTAKTKRVKAPKRRDNNKNNNNNNNHGGGSYGILKSTSKIKDSSLDKTNSSASSVKFSLMPRHLSSCLAFDKLHFPRFSIVHNSFSKKSYNFSSKFDRILYNVLFPKLFLIFK
jgi:hypothetical protein